MAYLCLLDESKIDERMENPFLVYGALVVHWSQLSSLNGKISEIRERTGYPAHVPFKWSGPDRAVVAPAAHARAKSDLLSALESMDAKLIVSLVHRGIAAGAADKNQNLRYGANAALKLGHDFLSEVDSTGLVLIDQFDGVEDALTEWTTEGLSYPGRGAVVPLPRFGSYSVTSCESSRLASAADVAIGAFGFCLNAKDPTVVANVATGVMPLILRDRSGTAAPGVSFFPVEPYVPSFRESYERVARILEGYGLLGLPSFP